MIFAGYQHLFTATEKQFNSKNFFLLLPCLSRFICLCCLDLIRTQELQKWDHHEMFLLFLAPLSPILLTSRLHPKKTSYWNIQILSVREGHINQTTWHLKLSIPLKEYLCTSRWLFLSSYNVKTVHKRIKSCLLPFVNLNHCPTVFHLLHLTPHPCALLLLQILQPACLSGCSTVSMHDL